jgi:hypothetical protein
MNRHGNRTNRRIPAMHDYAMDAMPIHPQAENLKGAACNNHRAART